MTLSETEGQKKKESKEQQLKQAVQQFNQIKEADNEESEFSESNSLGMLKIESRNDKEMLSTKFTSNVASKDNSK